MIRRAFGENERAFRLNGASWRDLEKAQGCGLGVIAARLAPLVALRQMGASGFPGGILGAIAAGHLGDARLDDVRETLLQGLIGSGEATSTEAGILVRKVFDEDLERGRGPMVVWAGLAFDILTRAIVGLDDEPQPGEKPAATGQPRRRSRTAKPGSPKSMPP